MALLLVAILIAIPAHSQPPKVWTTEPYFNEITIREGEGSFLLTMFSNNPDEGPGECCQVFRAKWYDLKADRNSITTDEGELIEIRPLKNECTIRIWPAGGEVSSGVWKLRNHEGTQRRYNVTVLPANQNAGCPNRADESCKLINLSTNEERECGSDVADWVASRYKCVYKLHGSMAFREEVLPPSPSALTRPHFEWKDVKESDTYGSYILECSLADDETISECTVEHKDTRRQYSVQEGLQHRTYSAFKTNYGAGICQFEIPKQGEDLDENDVGRWVMSVRSTAGQHKFCHLIVAPPGAKDKREVDRQIAINKIQGSTITCGENALYPIERCYIRNPEDEIVRQKDCCQFQLDMPGKWTCGFNAATADMMDLQQPIHVYASGAIDGRQADDSSLQCRHIAGKKLKTCLFISPAKKPFSIALRTLTDEAGLCKITFADRTEELVAGTWKCVIQVSGQDAVHSVDILVGDAAEGSD